MHRAFREHDLRPVTDLAGFWEFDFLGEVEPDDLNVKHLRFGNRMTVPGCFDTTPAYAGRRGLVAYRGQVRISAACPHRLVLDGVHHWCRIFVNGRAVRDHAGGFTRFAADFVPDRVGECEIIIFVDNRFNYRRSPLHMEYYDWYHYGGIARGAELHQLGPLWIESVRVTTTDLQSRTVRLQIDYRCEQDSLTTPLRVTCDGRDVLHETASLAGPTGALERTLQLPHASLWSPAAPNLHVFHVELGGDDIRTRIGLRQVKVDGRQILINDEPVRLLGMCRHEAHPHFGHTQPLPLLLSDMQSMLDLGCNFVRGTHYPQDERFLDLCDETGVCVWCEGNGWGNRVEHLEDPHFVQAELTCLDEMVSAAFNHPSVILWGAINEAQTNDARSRPAFEAFLNCLRTLDPSRPVTYASCFPLDDVCFDLADIISVNTYPGWYHSTIEEIGEHLEKVYSRINSIGLGDRPLIISEIGAGAIYNWRDSHEARWSEQYQAKLLERVISALFQEANRATGLSIWQFCDIRTSEMIPLALGRPKGFNNKGIVDEYRRPKLAYDTVRRLYHSLRVQDS